jgi:nicotinamidase-related amidase
VRVIHCTAFHRADGFGGNKNARLFSYMAKSTNQMTLGSPQQEIVREVAVAVSDLVLPRIHGLSPFQGTELDAVLRNEGIATIVGVGVSVNIAIQNLTFDAVNAGYQVVLPVDAVAGTPRAYAEAVFEHTLRNVATLVSTDDVLRAWA